MLKYPHHLPRALRQTAAAWRRWLAGLALVGGLGLPTAVSGQTQPGGAADSPTLRKVRDTGVIVLGHRLSSVPFSYLDAKLKPVGYSMDLCWRVVDQVRKRLDMPDLEVKLIAVTSATRMPLVANGTVDLECGVTTNTAERQRNQSFSITTFLAESRLLSRREEGVRTLDDLRGKPVVSTIATTSIQYLHHVNQSRKLDMKILVGLDDTDAFRHVQTGRAVAFAMDDVLLRSLLAGSPQSAEYVISDEAYSVEPYAIGLPRDDAPFKALVDGVLTDLYRRGEIFTIYQRWFQSPVPPKGLNLQQPMSEAFKRVIAKPTDSPDPAHYR
ncbi:amino acid ABC transporter substrate-binding protein [Ideonella paludis]|uniref:Amino acid ABC transporter substrate-binding protein n=1 Tax=Ideonella paludis TaxID=1233411 RepID=A0ABS5DVV7_9BURK|nr:amino acid ABC transporter substrate-binding protein [Ideonella paludis]MBQ0935219.1 amino acid ABC transporter substrate-binding protein [Ideonella paludis]